MSKKLKSLRKKVAVLEKALKAVQTEIASLKKGKKENKAAKKAPKKIHAAKTPKAAKKSPAKKNPADLAMPVAHHEPAPTHETIGAN